MSNSAGRLEKHDEIVSCLKEHILLPGEINYRSDYTHGQGGSTTAGARKSKVDSKEITKNSKLLLGLRSFKLHLTQKQLTNMLMDVAAANEGKWNLSTEKTEWAEETSKQVRNMLRDLSQALLKFKSKAKTGDQPTGWLKQFWNGDDEQGDGFEASDPEASESRPAASGNCPRASESGPEASENRPAASEPEATEEALPMQSRASSKSSETFSDGKMVRYCSQSRMAYRWEPGTNDKDWCQRMSKPSSGNEIIAVWPDGKFWRVPGMTVSMYYNTKPELPPLAKSAPSVKDNNPNMLWTGQDKNGGNVQVKYVRCVERKTSTNKSWVTVWHAAAKAENSDKKPKPVQVASISTTTYSKDQIEKVEVFMKELGMDFARSLCDKKSLDAKKNSL